jgi:tetratricopeptide (TPR) repeat protein
MKRTTFLLLTLMSFTAQPAFTGATDELVDQAANALRLGHALEARQLLLTAWRQADSIGKDDPSRARLEFALGSVYQELGDSRMAVPLLEDARRIWEKLGIEDVHSLGNLNFLGQVLFELQRPAEAERVLQSALQTARRVLGGRHEIVASVLDNLGTLYFVQGRIVEAERLLTEAVEMLRGEAPALRILASCLRVLAEVRLLQGRTGSARELFVEAEVLTSTLGEKSIYHAVSLSTLGNFYLLDGDAARAQPLLKKALRIYEAEVGPAHPDLVSVWGGLAEIALRDRKFLLAMQYLDRSRELTRKTYGPESPQLAVVEELMGRTLIYQGRLAQAQTLIEHSNGLLRRSYGKTHYRVANSYFLLGRVYAGQNRRDDAEHAYRRAIELFEQTLGEGHPKVAEALQHYASLLKKTDKKQARMVEQRSKAILSASTRNKTL